MLLLTEIAFGYKRKNNIGYYNLIDLKHEYNVQISKLELYKYCCLTIFKTILTLGDILIYTRLGETPCTLCMSKLPQIGLRPRSPPPPQSPPSPKILY